MFAFDEVGRLHNISDFFEVFGQEVGAEAVRFEHSAKRRTKGFRELARVD